MASGTLGISLTGLYAAQAGIRTTEHNIANVNTTGYRRQAVEQAANLPQYTGGTFLGRGVEMTTVRQAYDRFLDNEVLLNQGQLARHEVYATYAGQVDRLLSDEGSGIATGMDRFFAAVDEVVNDPASVVARQGMLSAGQGLAARFNALDNHLRELQSAGDAEVRTLVDTINDFARQLTRLNAAVARLENATSSPANDLRDQRDQVVAQLNKLVNVSVVEQADGNFNLFIGSGQTLVLGETAFSLSAIADPGDPERTVAALNLGGGSQVVLDENLITGGRLGGLMNLRADILQPALDDLNQLAVSLAGAVNAVHRAGFDQAGNTGVNFFSDPLTAAAGNTGTGVPALTHLGVHQDIPSQYTLTNNGANYTLTRQSDGASRTGTLAQVVDLDSDGNNDVGFSIAVAGAPAAGDSWTLDLRNYARAMSVVPTSGAGIAAASAANQPGNNVQALALADLRGAALMNSGSEQFSGFQAAAVSRNAILASEADLSVTTYTALSEQAVAAQQNVSGVNLDEEAANLIRYQQAYQAAARAIQIASSLFDEILSIVR
jgi:flagellar hook-associated protein 1 FlgK